MVQKVLLVDDVCYDRRNNPTLPQREWVLKKLESLTLLIKSICVIRIMHDKNQSTNSPKKQISAWAFGYLVVLKSAW